MTRGPGRVVSYGIKSCIGTGHRQGTAYMKHSFDTLLDYFLDYLRVEKGALPNTIESYGRDLQRYLDTLESHGVAAPDGISEEILELHMVSLSKQRHKAGTRARALSAIRQFHGFLYREGFSDHVPETADLRPTVRRPVPHALTIDQIERILEAPDRDSPTGLRDVSMLEMAYGAGLRISELCDLTFDELLDKEALLAVKGKGEKQRIVPYGKPAARALRAYLVKSRPLLARTRISKIIARRVLQEAQSIRPAGRHPAYGEPAFAAAFLRDPPARGRRGFALRSGAARTRRHFDDADLHECGHELPDRGSQDLPSPRVTAETPRLNRIDGMRRRGETLPAASARSASPL